MRWFALLFLLTLPAHAQDADVTKLRDALRRTTQELRAAQDQQAAATAALATATAERDAARAELAAMQAKAAEPAAPPPPAAPPKELTELQRRNASLSTTLARLQESGRQTSSAAAAAKSQAAAAEDRATRAQAVADACVKVNAEALKIGNEVVHLYQKPHFRTMLVLSDDPVFGLKRVAFENLMQDYEDKLRSNAYRSETP